MSVSELRDDDPLLTVGEVAAALRVSKMTIYRLIHAGDMPCVQVGRSFRVPSKAVDDIKRGADQPGRFPKGA